MCEAGLGIGEGYGSPKSHPRSRGSCSRRHILLFIVPQVPKEFRCRWPMPGIVVVAEGEKLHNFGIAHQGFENLDPIFQVASAVNDSLVPRCCLFLNPLAVA